MDGAEGCNMFNKLCEKGIQRQDETKDLEEKIRNSSADEWGNNGGLELSKNTPNNLGSSTVCWWRKNYLYDTNEEYNINTNRVVR